MGNSKTSQHADGRELLHPQSDLQAWMRSLAVRIGPVADRRLARDLRGAGFARLIAWRETRRTLLRAHTRAPSPTPLRDALGDLLRNPEVIARLSDAGRRFRTDEGDVALLWASALSANRSAARGLAEAGAA